MRKLGCLVCILVLLYLLFWPLARPTGWFEVPTAPALEGVLRQNDALAAAQLLPAALAPEDVIFDTQGRLLTGVADGRILRFTDWKQPAETFVRTQGRPLGLKFDAQGNLIVADGVRGLLSVDPQGQVTVLTSEAEGIPFRLADELDIGPDGTIYFSDASIYPLQDKMLNELLDGSPHGRLLAHDPSTKQTRVLLRDLYFANGIAVSPDGASVLVTETAAYRITRYWLDGPKKGQSEPFASNLPGFPDNLSISPARDAYWLALASPRLPMVETLQRNQFLRKILLRLPRSFLPAPKAGRYGFVLKLDLNGKILQSLQDPVAAATAQVTSVVEHEGHLYLGNITDESLRRLPLPPLP